MKEARYISTLIILALLLGVYDLLRERYAYTTIASLLVVMALFSAWMVAQFIFTRLMRDYSLIESDSDDNQPEIFYKEESTASPETETARLSSMSEPTAKVVSRVKLPHAMPPVNHGIRMDAAKPAIVLTAQTRAQVHKIVAELCGVSGIRSASILSTQGEVMVSVPAISMPSTQMAALTVSIFALSLRLMNQFGSSKLEEIIVEGTHGLVYFQSAGKETYIMATIEEEMALGSVVQELHRTAKLVAAAIAAQ